MKGRYLMTNRDAPPIIKIHEVFKIYPDIGECEFDSRAFYSAEDGVIEYHPSLHAAGIEEIIETINHEWMHVMCEWGIIGDKNELAFKVHDCTGDSDHFIMKVINYGE